MALALETFLVALSVIVDDLYQSHIPPRLPAWGGPPAQMRAAEGRCLGRAASWRRGGPWQSERGLRREVRKQVRRTGRRMTCVPTTGMRRERVRRGVSSRGVDCGEGHPTWWRPIHTCEGGKDHEVRAYV